MSLNIETSYLEDRQARLTVTVDPTRVEKEMRSAAQRISRKVNIPGFRKGKAPYPIILQYFGEAALLDEALDPLGQAVYREALDQTGIDAYAPGSLTDIRLDPLVMEFTIPLDPEVVLTDYRTVRVDWEDPKIDEKDVERTLREMQNQQATLEPVEQPISMGTAAHLSIKGEIVTKKGKSRETEAWMEQESVRVLISEEATYPVPGFAAEVVGMASGEERTFDIKLGKDDDLDEELRGKTVQFTVQCKEVFSYEAPPLDDEFAKSVSEFATIEELRADTLEGLKRIAERNSREAYLEKVLEELEGIATVTYPPVLAEMEVNRRFERLEERVRNQGLSMESYYQVTGTTEEQIKSDYLEDAKVQVRRSLILGKVVEEEGIVVSDAEIDDEIDTMLLSFGAQAAIARQVLRSGDNRNSVRTRLLTEKGTDRLIAIARGIAPDKGVVAEPAPEALADESASSDGDASEAEASPKRRTRKKE